ncbi:hypothetical protein BH11PLA2_BH11PLA2_47020 [soil metagenome]
MNTATFTMSITNTNTHPPIRPDSRTVTLTATRHWYIPTLTTQTFTIGTSIECGRRQIIGLCRDDLCRKFF